MTDQHARPSGAGEEPLYDADVPTPTHGERARTLLESLSTGALCTIATEPAGFPYGSFITFAANGGNPLFFISALAEHTRNLKADSRASLLVAEGGGDDPLARARVTLIGHCRTVPEEDRAAAVATYLAVHPNAEYYIDFKDFSFWRLDVESLRYIGGYGRMSWVDIEEWRRAEPDPIAPHAAAILAHMNDDHAHNLRDYCRAFTKATDATAAQMTSIDRYGFEMSVETAKGRRPVRLAFPQQIATPQDARRELVALADAAREAQK
jgi:heme iron utilization protein